MAIFCWINNPQIAEIIVGKRKKIIVINYSSANFLYSNNYSLSFGMKLGACPFCTFFSCMFLNNYCLD